MLIIHSISIIGVVLTSLTAENVTMHVASFINKMKPGKLSKPFLSETSLERIACSCPCFSASGNAFLAAQMLLTRYFQLEFQS